MDWITMKRKKELGFRCNLPILTSRRRCEFDVGVSTLIRRCHYNIHDILWDELTIQCLDKAAIILWTWRGSVNLLKTYQIWRPLFQLRRNVTNTAFILYCEFNKRSNVEATLEQRRNFNVVTSTSLKRCVLVAWSYDLTATLSQRRILSGSMQWITSQRWI